jgi:hypothetical protein
MISKMRSMTFVLLLIMLFSGVVHGRSEDMVTDMRIDRWFTNLFYPPVYDPFDIDHAVAGSTKWFDYKKLVHKGTETPMVSPQERYNLLDENKKPRPKAVMVGPGYPEYLPNGMKNIYGYNWIYHFTPDEMGPDVTPEYIDAVKAYLAYLNSLTAGVGPLY